MPLPPRLVVVHAVGQFDMGGMEKLLVEFARHADRERFELHFVSIGPRGVVADELEALGCSVSSLDRGDGLHPGLMVRLARLFRRLNADVVHTHNTRPLMYAGPAACLAGVERLIHTRHGQRYGASRLETALFRIASLTVNRFVCVSRDSAIITRGEGISPRRIRTLWNGIDLTRFRPAIPEGSGPIVAVGRLSPEKDFMTLVRAAAIAVRRDPSFRLDIAGDGVSMPEIKSFISESGLDGAMRLLGQIRDIPSLLSSASAFTLASLTEGVSLTILEAMAAGLPVVATRVGGNPEVVVHEQTGLLVPPSEPEALAAALLKLWHDPAERRVMGVAGRARVEAHFDVRKMVAEYEELYLEGWQARNRNSARAARNGLALKVPK
jgi:sugar transferase (PEP-CTERM/EpsH1 system associated)